MAIEVTEEAIGVLRNSLALAKIDLAEGGARLYAARGPGGGPNVQVELADGPAPGEQVIEAGEIRIFIDQSVVEALPNAIVGVEPPHGRIVVTPAQP